MVSSEDYLAQHFNPRPSQKGAKENSDAYNTRMYWFNNNFPSYRKVAEAFGFKTGRVENYANKYNWKFIREKYEELVNKEELRKEAKKQKQWEKQIDQSNELTFKITLRQKEQILMKLNLLPDNPSNIRLTNDEEKELKAELDRLDSKLMKLQTLIRTNIHLPNSYNDKQINENNTKVDGELNMTHFHKKSMEEVLKENESEIGKFIKRTIKKED